MPRKDKIQMKFEWIPTDEHFVEVLTAALKSHVSKVLLKHNAALKVDLEVIIRRHLKL